MDKPEAGQELTSANKFQKVFYHKRGDPQENDAVVFQDKERSFRSMNAMATGNEKGLLISVSDGTHGNELYGKDLSKQGSPARPKARREG